MTAMDEHFAGGETDANENDGAEQAAAPAQSKLDAVKQNAHWLVGAALLATGASYVYMRHFASPAPSPAPVAAFETIEAPANEPAPLVMNSQIPSSVSSAPDLVEPPVPAAASAAIGVASPAPVTAPIAPAVTAFTPQPPAAPGAQTAPMATGAQLAGAQPAKSVEQQPSPEVAELRRTLAAEKARVSALESKVKSLQAELAARPAQAARSTLAPAARPAPSPSAKPAPPAAAAKSATKAAAANPASSAPSTVTPVPSRYRVYAMRENMAWVQDTQTRETIPAPVGATLPDGSRVTGVDEGSGVVQTTSGSIRYGSGGRPN